MNYPGSPSHQKMLKAIADHYQHDPRIRAVTVFGSLARGNWDQYSDLDLDIIVREEIDPVGEVNSLDSAFQAVGEKLALVIPDEGDAVDLVLESLTEISIRYHTLQTTKYAIVEHLIKIAGDLDLDTIKQAGLTNYSKDSASPGTALNKCFRYAVEIKTAIERQRFWMAVELLHRTRNLLMEIFSLTSGGERFIHHFDRSAPQELSDLLFSILPTANTLSQAFENLLGILQNEIPQFSNGQLHLKPHHQTLLQKLK